MKLSNKCRYGLRAMVDLAINAREKQVALIHLAERNGLSLQYLEQVFTALRRGGLVKGIKGSQGGYYLAKAPEEITLAQIITVLDGDYHIDAENLTDQNPGKEFSETVQRMVIERLNQQLDQVLEGITLKDLEDDYANHHKLFQDMYYI